MIQGPAEPPAGAGGAAPVSESGDEERGGFRRAGLDGQRRGHALGERYVEFLRGAAGRDHHKVVGAGVERERDAVGRRRAERRVALLHGRLARRARREGQHELREARLELLDAVLHDGDPGVAGRELRERALVRLPRARDFAAPLLAVGEVRPRTGRGLDLVGGAEARTRRVEVARGERFAALLEERLRRGRLGASGARRREDDA